MARAAVLVAGAKAGFLQVSDSDIQVGTPSTPTQEQETIVEEQATPISEELPLATLVNKPDQDRVAMEVVQATKRLLESIRLRDFQAYE